MKISVIVPVYNVQEYIVECLESIMIQELKDIEIIIVNDGSTDKSISNIQNIIDNNSNIHLINKVNGGLSSARNTGLSHAKGEYVLFVDSDDYLEKDFLYKLYNEAKEYDLDIACGGYTKFYENNATYPQIRNEILCKKSIISGQKFLLNQLDCNDYRMEVWDDLYKREFLLENNLFFVEGLLHEDEEFTPRALLAAKRVKIVETYGYMYRQRENSIMSSTVNIKHVSSVEYIINSFINHFEKTKIEHEKLIFSKLCCNIFNAYIEKVLRIDIDNKYKFIRNIRRKEIINVMNYNSDLSWKQRLKILLFNHYPFLFYKVICINREKRLVHIA